MKRPVLFITILTILITFLSFGASVKVPPGTVHWKENLFMDAQEISNLNWKEYIYWLKINDAKKVSLNLPDTMVWMVDSFNVSLITEYYNHPAYHNYPVVGVSHQQAKDYCTWRTMVVNQNRKEKQAKVLYRLPTKAEWEAVAKYPLKKSGKWKKYDDEDLAFYNLNGKKTTEAGHTTNPARSYVQNELGIYNMLGNVAEFVEEEGIAKGGSWRHNLEESLPEQVLNYEKPTDWLGFRCICELKN